MEVKYNERLVWMNGEQWGCEKGIVIGREELWVK